MYASCFTPVILIPSITFICISVKLSFVNKEFSFESTGVKFGGEGKKHKRESISQLHLQISSRK